MKKGCESLVYCGGLIGFNYCGRPYTNCEWYRLSWGKLSKKSKRFRSPIPTGEKEIILAEMENDIFDTVTGYKNMIYNIKDYVKTKGI